MSYNTLSFECRDHVGWLTLNRPDRLNALSMEMVRELRQLFGAMDEHLDARVIVFRGAGRAFCSGFDVSGLSDGMALVQADTNMPTGMVTYGHIVQRTMNDLILKMRQAPQPIIGAIRGPAVGGGFTLSMACDIRIVSENVRFNAANIRIGYTGADMGSSYLLPRLIGFSRAAEYMYTGKLMDAAAAERIGFVSKVVPDDELDGAAEALARQMLNATPLALRMTKELLNVNIDAPSLMAALQLEAGCQLLCGMSEDVSEALKAAYIEKRPPIYKDR